MSVINGKKYCGKRENKLNLVTMKKPAAKKDGEAYKCKDKDYKLCGKPTQDLAQSRVFCVPKKVDCPLTAISFDKDGKVKKKEELQSASAGPPLINVQLSEGGPPCIYNNESFSSQVSKEKMILFPEGYYSQCQSVVFGSPSLSEYFGDKPSGNNKEVFKVSKLYTEVKSFKGTSEYQLL